MIQPEFRHHAGPEVFDYGVCGEREPACGVAPRRILEIERDGAPRDPERISRIMIERLLSRAVGLAREDMDYLLGKLDALMAERDRRSIVGEPQRRRRAL